MANVTLNVNGRMQTVDVEPSTPLLYVLRNDLDLQGPRFGCGLGQCGACTVLVNGTATRSCVTPVSSVKGPITTLEGLSSGGALHPIQQAWIDEQVPACGYCQNGQMLTAVALLQRNARPSDAQIREAMAPVLCRCFTYYRIQAAIKRASGAGPTASLNDPAVRGTGPRASLNGPAVRGAGPTASLNDPAVRGAGPTASLNDPAVRGAGPTASLNASSRGPAGEIA